MMNVSLIKPELVKMSKHFQLSGPRLSTSAMHPYMHVNINNRGHKIGTTIILRCYGQRKSQTKRNLPVNLFSKIMLTS